MSWDPFRDNLVASGHVTKAALCGLDGSVWTQSPGMDVSWLGRCRGSRKVVRGPFGLFKHDECV